MNRGTVGVVVAVTLVVAALAPGVVGASAVGSHGLDGESMADASHVEQPTSATIAQTAPPGNNSTVSHRNPEEVSGDENLSQAQMWLAREMAGSLSESVNVSQADRERARQLISNDSQFADLAEQYAEVSDETDSGEQLDRFTEVGSVQREFLADAQRYRETLREYRAARENNATTRARRLAHELERRAEAVNRTAVRLNESYANLSSVRQSELDGVRRDIGRVRGNVTETQESVVNETLVRTTLTLRATEGTGSFTDPLRFAGRLRTANGTAVADRNVTLQFGNRTVETRTDGTGRFTAAYRPTSRAVGQHRAPVAYRPANESAYASDNATVEFAVEQVAPNVTVTNRTRRVAYNDTLVVNGTVGADGAGAPGVPLNVTVGGVRVGHAETRPDGSFGLAARVPGNVSNGTRRVQVRVNQTGRALGPATGSAQVEVASTPTELSITDVETLNETAYVAGQLFAGGEPLPNRTVELAVNGTTVGNATTNATGAFATTVSVPERLLGGSSDVQVEASYASEGNLRPSRANATLTFGAGGSSLFGEAVRLGVAGLLGVAVLGAFVWRLRSDSDDELDGSTDPSGEARPGGDSGDAAGGAADALLDSATASLADDRYDAAVVTAYAAIRARLDGDGSGVARTHWEFFDARREDLPDEAVGRLEKLTETYERAAFATDSVAGDRAEEAVAAAEALVGDAGSGDGWDAGSGGGRDAEGDDQSARSAERADRSSSAAGASSGISDDSPTA